LTRSAPQNTHSKFKRGEKEVSEDLVGLAIVLEDAAVGFLVLKRRSRAPSWASPNSAIVSGMRIDQRIQGSGVGSRALTLLSEWLRHHWPETKEISLSVDELNTRGIKAYSRAGFKDLGQRVQGRIGWVRYMRKPLQSSTESAANPSARTSLDSQAEV
jgi:RimJ/RimL family protein N-acetyltransferase